MLLHNSIYEKDLFQVIILTHSLQKSKYNILSRHFSILEHTIYTGKNYVNT